MIRNGQIQILVPWVVRTSDGVAVKDFNPDCVWINEALWDNRMVLSVSVPTFWCDVQPFQLNEYERQVWGISDLKAGSRKLFIDITLRQFWPMIDEGNRIVFQNKNYDVMAVNPWPHHVEAIMSPAQGE